MPTAAIVGLGLVGTSLALGWRQANVFSGLVGVDPDPKARAIAVERGAVDDVSPQLDVVAAADVVVLAAPVAATVAMAPTVARHARGGCIVTDVCSVKGVVMDEYRRVLGERAWFIGGHPMAGSEHKGAAAAQPTMFRDAPYVLIPAPGVPEHVLAAVRSLVTALGARPLVMSAEEHDQIVALTSHLTQVIASALMLAVGEGGAAAVDPLQLAGPGLRDMTRVAGSPGDLWLGILRHNAANVLAALDEFELVLNRFRKAIQEIDNTDAVAELIDAGARQRRRLEEVGRLG